MLAINMLFVAAYLLTTYLSPFFCTYVAGHQQSPFDRILSPRTVKTKYGSLRGVLISLTGESSDSPTSSSPETPTSSVASAEKEPLEKLTSVEAFLGVPYAAPPVNSLRFMPPVTPSHWRGVRLANEYSHTCPQKLPPIYENDGSLKESSFKSKDSKSSEKHLHGYYEYYSQIIPLLSNQSEDCLYLNVFVPFSKDTGKIRLPVMVYIHGDSYNWGSGNIYDGTILASVGQVVIVTLNYRLGIFGFLPTLVDGATRGNHGLMDIIAALHWVSDNIREIGGDESNVTLVGHSKGAALVNLLMISPMSQGLFSRAVLMSGSALSAWSLSSHAENYAKYLSKLIDCPNYDSVLMVECLRTKTMSELLKVDLENGGDEFYQTSFGPIVDGLVIPSDPRLMMESPNSSHQMSPLYSNIRSKHSEALGFGSYSVMFGVTRVESPILFDASEQKQGIDLDRRDSILRNLIRKMVNYYQEVITLTLINEYTDWSGPSEHPINILDSLIDIIGDALVVAPITSSANLHFRRAHQQKQHQLNMSKSQLPKMFSYVFVYQSEAYGYAARLGCIHGDELPYLFGAPIAYHLLGKNLAHFRGNYTKSELALSHSMITQWSNFIRFGNPNGNKSVVKEHLDQPIWPEYDAIQRKYLMIGLKPKIRDHYHSHRLSFWLNLIPKLEKHGKEESDHLKRHLQDQGALENGQVSAFERISLKFLSSLQSPKAIDGISEKGHSQSSSSGDRKPESGPSVSVAGENREPRSGTVESEGIANFSGPFQYAVGQQNFYSTALTLTIAVGVSLLAMNGLVFAGVYYYHQRNRPKAKKHATKSRIYGSEPQEEAKIEAYPSYCCENHHLCTFAEENPSINPTCHHLMAAAVAEPQATHSPANHQQRTQQNSNSLNNDSKPCQCASCYHPPTVCDNEHCITVIHEYNENF